jgi:hypothetical protein
MSAIQSQNKAISDLYKVQEFLLTQLQIEPVQEQGLFPEIKKSKNEKPN